MARVPMITRTIQTTKCSVLCVDIENKTTTTKEITIPRTYKDEKTMIKQVEKAIADENIKPVNIITSVVIETLYGMPEQEFIDKATVLPTRGTTENTDNK